MNAPREKTGLNQLGGKISGIMDSMKRLWQEFKKSEQQKEIEFFRDMVRPSEHTQVPLRKGHGMIFGSEKRLYVLPNIEKYSEGRNDELPSDSVHEVLSSDQFLRSEMKKELRLFDSSEMYDKNDEFVSNPYTVSQEIPETPFMGNKNLEIIFEEMKGKLCSWYGSNKMYDSENNLSSSVADTGAVEVGLQFNKIKLEKLLRNLAPKVLLEKEKVDITHFKDTKEFEEMKDFLVMNINLIADNFHDLQRKLSANNITEITPEEIMHIVNQNYLELTK